MSKFFSTNRCRGFTLIELVVIMVLIGVLAVFSIGRFADRSSFEARGYYDELTAATRYAQRYAVASGCTVRITIDGAGNYSLSTQDAVCGVGTSVQGPDGSTFSGAAPSGVSVSPLNTSFDFDALGATGAGGMVQVQGGGSTHSFTITAGSGFVQ